LRERIGESLFYVPSLFMLGAVVLSQLLVGLDRSLAADQLPTGFDTTVGSTRVVLSVIAGGTITAASIVFSLTLVAVQLASTQFSPRTLGSFLGDRAQQVIMGVVLGTFVYCLLVLRVVRGPLEEGSDSFVPRSSVMVAVVLGVVALIAVIASINRTAQSLRVETVAATVSAETLAAIEAQFGSDKTSIAAPIPAASAEVSRVQAPGDAVEVVAPRSGWIQDISIDRLLQSVAEGSYVLLHRSVGSYVIDGELLASAWPNLDDRESVAEAVARAFVIAEQRSRQGDVGFGITQLVDIAVRALSPGVNDPKTAEELVLRLGDILVALAVRDLPPTQAEIDGRTIVRAAELSHADYVDLAVEPIRRFARKDPRVLSALVRTLAASQDVAKRLRGDAAVAPLRDQIELIRADASALPSEADRNELLRTIEAVAHP
jgi:uncharacterized membrane protein